MPSDIETIRSKIKYAKSVVFLGGAGVSTASGISDFRSPAGIYNIKSKYGVPYEIMLSHTFFVEHTETFYDFYWSTMVNFAAKPNSAHRALADFEKSGHRLTILTQNIDGLHQAAGSQHVLELHGSVWRYICQSCGRRYSLEQLDPHGIPHCSCGGILKPDVVLYEEPLNEDVLQNAVSALRMANVLIIGGTSLNVYPAAGLVDYYAGSAKIIINKETTPYDRSCDFVFHDDVGKILAEILN